MKPADLEDIVTCCRCNVEFRRRDGEFMCVRHDGHDYLNYYICGYCHLLWNKYYYGKLKNVQGKGWVNWEEIFFRLFLKEKHTFIFR